MDAAGEKTAEMVGIEEGHIQGQMAEGRDLEDQLNKWGEMRKGKEEYEEGGVDQSLDSDLKSKRMISSGGGWGDQGQSDQSDRSDFDLFRPRNQPTYMESGDFGAHAGQEFAQKGVGLFDGSLRNLG